MSPLTRQQSMNAREAFQDVESKEDSQSRGDYEDTGVKSVGDDMGELLISGDGGSKDVALSSPKQNPLSINVARPHHLPKMTVPESLSNKMEEIRKSMAMSGGLDSDAAPWDATGKPKMKKKKKKDKEKKEVGIDELEGSSSIGSEMK